MEYVILNPREAARTAIIMRHVEGFEWLVRMCECAFESDENAEFFISRDDIDTVVDNIDKWITRVEIDQAIGNLDEQRANVLIDELDDLMGWFEDYKRTSDRHRFTL